LLLLLLLLLLGFVWCCGICIRIPYADH